MIVPRDRCLVARKWAASHPCDRQCKTCQILCPIVVAGNPDEETPEGLYRADAARLRLGFA